MSGSTTGLSGALALLRSAKLIPVLTITDLTHAVPLAKALVAGGVRTLEITLRTAFGAQAAAAVRAEVPDAMVGLGTVLTAHDLAICKEHDLHFAFSPGASPALLDAAEKMGIDFVPGIQTASEIMACLERGFDVMKFFPAVPAGGIAAVKALAGPFPHVRFCPTGGINEADTAAWLKLPNVVAVGGSWLAPPDEVERGDWAAITARASRAMAALA
ncbi:bifunctional 4-hydroxy-2-oxoglutarate aldolase/2-dehydro-3-deoxy-phosphogluconate aldolase [Beijerinckia sp. L45]|uniref:bifunctional 4-hydroxy-2-oxoglutarate aldolase/2-dehydro-3-deoxy-phosphogluconate aldolase n=1 Tax=Beijerinckia sp. L45 TaxID=1641855 RepID=UPI00131B9C2C|nr:bifunctional 4-hydroxy-2-oxoglutarate aldolase/2-dehydro-3-deoxy-phosphogluconate aldolase [Beijerinckia sp. L45]